MVNVLVQPLASFIPILYVPAVNEVNVLDETYGRAPFKLYEYVGVPPVPVIEILPVEAPLQLTGEAVAVRAKTGGSVIATVVVAIQPAASFTDTL